MKEDIGDIEEEYSDMDRQLFLIADQLPKDILQNVAILVGTLPGFKEIVDMTAFFIIEFHTKVDALAAKANGFCYTHNGQNMKQEFWTMGVIQIYVRNIIKQAQEAGVIVGKGF